MKIDKKKMFDLIANQFEDFELTDWENFFEENNKEKDVKNQTVLEYYTKDEYNQVIDAFTRHYIYLMVKQCKNK